VAGAVAMPRSGCCWAVCELLACSLGLSWLHAAKPIIKTMLQHKEINLYMEYPPKIVLMP
jgi:hypothetical protein